MRVAVSTLLVSALSVLSAGPVLAGEDIEPVPVYTEPLRPLPFAGAYIGATVGWVRADADQTIRPLPDPPVIPPPPSSDDDGWALGGHIGYSWQSGALVYGVETDLSWMDVDPSFTAPINLPRAQAGETTKTSYDYFGTIRGRLGWAFEHVLIYGTGGYAYAGLDHTFVAPLIDLRQSDSDVKSGWTAGGGIEVALGHWTVRAEALYVDLQDTTITYTKRPPGCPIDVCRTRIRWEDDFVTARVGFSIPLHHKKQVYEPLK